MSDQQNEEDEARVYATEDSEDVSGEYIPMCISVCVRCVFTGGSVCVCAGVYVVYFVYVRGIMCVFCACMWMHVCVWVCACVICVCICV